MTHRGPADASAVVGLEKTGTTARRRATISAVTSRSSTLGLVLLLVLGASACGGSDDDAQLVIPGAGTAADATVGSAPDVVSTDAPPASEPATDDTAGTAPGTAEPTPDTAGSGEPPATSGPDDAASGALGFVEVDGDRYGLEESAFCYIGASGATGSFLGRSSEGRTGVLALDIDPEYGPGVNFQLDMPSLDLGAEAPETSPQYEARSQTVMEIGTLDATVDGDTASGSGTAADLNSASMFEADHAISFSARCA